MTEPTEMPVGAAFDAEIDRIIFDKVWVKHPYCVINGQREDIPTWLPEGDSPDDPPGGWTWGETPPPYSTSRHHALTIFFAAVEMFGHAQIDCDMEDYGREPGDLVTVWVGLDAMDGYTGNLPEAICRAALAACEPPTVGRDA